MKFLIYDPETAKKITAYGRNIIKELLEADEAKFKVDDKVKLPLGETGTIISIKNLLWGFKYTVRIRHATFNKTNQHETFRAQDMEHEEPEIKYIDYISILKPESNKPSAESYAKMARIAEELRNIAVRENVVIVCGSQEINKKGNDE